MTTYYVDSNATAGLDNGTSWTDAYLTFSQAITSATTNNDQIWVASDHQEEVSFDTTYAFGADVNVICKNKTDDSNAIMGTGGWIGNSTTNRSIFLSGVSRKIYQYGITYRTAGTSAENIRINMGGNSHYELEECYIWQGNTGTAGYIGFNATGDKLGHTRCKNCTFRFGSVNQEFRLSSDVVIEGGSISSAGSIPSTLVELTTIDSTGGTMVLEGMDLSHLTNTTILGSVTRNTPKISLVNCKLGTGMVMIGTQTVLNKATGSVTMFDCDSGDNHMSFAYADILGSIVMEQTIKFTSGAANQSWKIVTTANCSYFTPFVCPWIDLYNDVLTSQSPYLEILRDGSTTAYQDDEVWGEFAYKNTVNTTKSDFVNDRMALLGTPTNQTAGAGLASWSGESGTAWSGKVEAGSITAKEIGHIRGRLCVGLASTTVYLDPQVRV